MPEGKFQGIHNGDSRNGKWKLSDDNKTLTIKISIISIKFKIESFDEKKRVTSSDKPVRWNMKKWRNNLVSHTF